MDIVIAIDRNYISQCIVLVFSIISTNRNTTFRFYIFSEDLSEKEKQFIVSYFPQETISFFFIQVDSEQIKSAKFSDDSHLTMATYYRLLIPDLLPQDLNKVLYLDGDMLVTGSIKELWETDLTGYSTAVTTDSRSNDIQNINRLGISAEYEYFNAGMLLINLDYWRNNFVHRKAFEFIEANSKACKYHDQDALNKILPGTVRYVSVKYNYLDIFFENEENFLMKTEFIKDVKDSLSDIVIMHYTNRLKPWHIECTHPNRDLWLSCHKKVFKRKFKKYFSYKGLRLIKRLVRILLTNLHLCEDNYVSKANMNVCYFQAGKNSV